MATTVLRCFDDMERVRVVLTGPYANPGATTRSDSRVAAQHSAPTQDRIFNTCEARCHVSGRLTVTISLKVNGATHSVDAEPDTPLLYVLRNDLKLNGAKYGCAMTQCGACTVLVNGAARRSCVTPVGSIEGNEVTTLEGLGTLDKLHPLQKAFIDEQAAQCGYCASGMIMAAADLLNRNPQPQEADVRAALAGNLCRCGTHNRIIRAVLRAAKGAA